MEENRDLADASYPMNWTSQRIELGKQKSCRGWCIKHPGNFYVILKEYWNRLEDNQRRLNEFYDSPVNSNDGSSPLVKNDANYMLDPANNNAGIYVVAYVRDEWHRALIMDSGSNRNSFYYLVFLIDYGEDLQIAVDQIRRIPKNLLRNFPAQAIKCSLEFEEGAKSEFNCIDFKWTETEAGIFFKIMQDCQYVVEFVRYEINNDLPNPIRWFCKVWLVHHKTIEKKRKRIVDQTEVVDRLFSKFNKFNSFQMKFQEDREDTSKRERNENEDTKNSEPDLEKEVSWCDPWEECLEECSINSLENCTGINMSLNDFMTLVDHVPST